MSNTTKSYHAVDFQITESRRVDGTIIVLAGSTAEAVAAARKYIETTEVGDWLDPDTDYEHHIDGADEIDPDELRMYLDDMKDRPFGPQVLHATTGVMNTPTANDCLSQDDGNPCTKGGTP